MIIILSHVILQSSSNMSHNKAQRDCLIAILREIRFQTLSRPQQDQLMAVVGFEEDVAFAKSLFTDRLAQIYKELDGQYQKFLAKDAVVGIGEQGREILIAIFRKYHELKMNQKAEGKGEANDISSLKLPDSSNIEEVIAFQKRMYGLFKHLIPQGNTTNRTNPMLFYQPSPMKFNPYSIYPPQRSFRSLQSDFPPTFPPFMPVFSHRPSIDSLRRSDSHVERQSFLSRNSFSQFQRASFTNSPHFQEEEHPLNGFTTRGEDEEAMPNKKIKRDTNIHFAPENVQSMRRELELLANTRKVLPVQRNANLQGQKSALIDHNGGSSKQGNEEGDGE